MTLKNTRLGWLLFAVGICWLGWLLFVTHLDYESMWYDEWFTWEYSRQGLLDLVTNTAIDVHPPVYYLWVWAWITWTQNDDVFVMRLSSVIPAVLAVAMCYRVGCDWFRSRWVGLAAAAFLATSGIFVYYARELRMYTLIVLMALGSWWLLWRALRHKTSLKGYAALVGLMIYTYYFTAFIIVIQAITASIFYRKRFVNLALAYGAALITFLPWLPTLYNQLVQESLRAGHSGELSLGNIGKFAATQPTSLEAAHEWLLTFSANQPAFMLLLIGLAFLLIYNAPRAYRQRFIVAAAWLLGTILLFWGINLALPVYSLRYTLIVIPAFALLVGVAVDQLPAYTRFTLIGLVGVIGVVTHSSAFPEPKLPHRDLIQTIADHYMPGDRIWYNFSTGALGSSIQFESLYYLERIAPNISTDEFVWDAPDDFEDVQAVPRVWDVRPYWIEIPENVTPVLETGRDITEEYRVQGYWIRLYEAPPEEQIPVVFGDVLALQIGPMEQTLYEPGDTVKVKTWWRALEAPTLDYSYGLFLRRADTVIAQADQGLAIEDKPTSQWPVSSAYGFTLPTLDLPADLAPGDYDLWLAVYYWEDPRPLSVSAPDDDLVNENIVRVAQISIQ